MDDKQKIALLVAALKNLKEQADGMTPDRVLSNRDWADFDEAISEAQSALDAAAQ